MVIDFENEFQSFIAVWMKRENIDTDDFNHVDARLDEVYDAFLNEPSEVFGNKKPRHFFDDVENAASLVRILKKYINERIAIPGPLLNRLVEMKDDVYPIIAKELCETAGEDGECVAINIWLIELISEMGFPHPIDAYITAISSADTEQDAFEAMIDVLKNNVSEIKDKIKKAYLETQYEYAKDSFVDILSELPGDEDAYKFALECFIYDVSKCGMYAHMLSKIGNPACIPFLEDRLKEPALNYFNFCRVKEAIEELGGETAVERDFSGDSDYEYMSEIASDDFEEKDGEEEIEIE